MSRAPADMARAEIRRNQAIELRKAGASYEAIGKKLGVSLEAARKLVTGMLNRLERANREAAEDVRRLDTERIDTAILALQPGIRSGDAKSITALAALMKRRAEMWGTDVEHEFTRERIDMEKQKREDDHKLRRLEIQRLANEIATGVDTSTGVSKIEVIEIAPYTPKVAP